MRRLAERKMILKLIGLVGLFLFFWSLAVWVASDWKETDAQNQAKSEIENFERLKKGIRRLNDTLDQIEQIETLVTDIDKCAPGKRHTSFSVHWGGKNKYGFMLDGDGITTEDLRTLAVDEHERLCTSLLRQIQELQGK